MFVSIEEARRIEWAEVAQLLACAQGLTSRRPAGAVVHRNLRGGVVTWAGKDSPLTKIALVGEAELVEEDLQLAEECLFEIPEATAAQAPVEVCSLADPEVFQVLARRGYRLMEFEDVLGRTLDPGGVAMASDCKVADGSLSVERVETEDLGLWARVMATGFAVADEQGVESDQKIEVSELEALLLDLSAADGVRRYLARRNGEVAGAAGMRPTNGIAQLAGAATLAEHRRQGVQRALLDHRLAEAASEGCGLAVVTTQPASTSQHNVMRLGFSKLYSRALLKLDQ